MAQSKPPPHLPIGLDCMDCLHGHFISDAHVALGLVVRIGDVDKLDQFPAIVLTFQNLEEVDRGLLIRMQEL